MHPNLDQVTDSLPRGTDLIVCKMMTITLTLLGRRRGGRWEELKLGHEEVRDEKARVSG